MIATGKFSIDKKGKKSKLIYRIRNSASVDIKINITHISIKLHEYFNVDAQTFKCSKKDDNYNDAKKAQEDLINFSDYVSDAMISENSATTKFSSKWLKCLYNDYFKLSDVKNEILAEEDFDPYFIDYFNHYIEKNAAKEFGTNGKNLAKKTVDGYNTMINYWKEFLNHNHRNDYKLSEIDQSVFDQYVYYQENICILNDGSVETNVNKFKALISHARSKKKIVHEDYAAGLFKYNSKPVNMIYLSDDEIEKILNLELDQEYSHLEQSRDWFIIQLFTGLRISDLFRLNQKYFNDGNIEIKTKKTNALCVIPLFKPTQSIIDKYSGKLPKNLCDQTYNKHIKKICELAKIDHPTDGSLAKVVVHNGKKIRRKIKGTYPKYKLVSSHTCRRSLLTNLSKKDVQTVNLMGISGHSNIKTLENYIKTSTHEKAKAVKEKILALGGMY